MFKETPRVMFKESSLASGMRPGLSRERHEVGIFSRNNGQKVKADRI